MTKYLGIIDGESLAGGSIHEREHVLVFNSVTHARDVFYRYYWFEKAPGSYDNAVNLDGKYPGDIPGMGKDAKLTLWTIPKGAEPEAYWAQLAADTDPYPDLQLWIGPSRGIRLSHL